MACRTVRLVRFNSALNGEAPQNGCGGSNAQHIDQLCFELTYVTNQNKRRHWVVVEVVSLQCEELGMAPYPMARGVTCRSLAEAYHIIVNSGALTTPVYVPAFYLKSSFLSPLF